MHFASFRIPAALTVALVFGTSASARHLSFEDRVAAQRAVERVYWNHRIWPKENPQPKPPLEDVLPDSVIRARVDDSLRKVNALETFWQRPITDDQLQAELERITKHSHDPAVLRQLFDALGNDPFVIAETLVRPALADRLIRNWYAYDDRIHVEAMRKAQRAWASCENVDCVKELAEDYKEVTFILQRDGTSNSSDLAGMNAIGLDLQGWMRQVKQLSRLFGVPSNALPLQTLSSVEETPEQFVITAVLLKSDDQLKLAIASWQKVSWDQWWTDTASRLSQDRDPVQESTARSLFVPAITTDDTWTPTCCVEPPVGRELHTAVWTGSEMIVWGGYYYDGFTGNYPVSGGRYNPATDTWTDTADFPSVTGGRRQHTAIWTGTEMIIYGGDGNYGGQLGSRYNPTTDTWTATTTLAADVGGHRYLHTAVWTGTEMIIWGGFSGTYLNTGGRYNPTTNSWTATSTGANVPVMRRLHSAIWTGSEMIIWGGFGGTPSASPQNTGGRYNPSTDSWSPTSVGANVPMGRYALTATWTGSEMVVWGGRGYNGSDLYFNTGGRYRPSTNSWTPTSTGANVPSGRYYHTAIWTGTQMVVWGGYLNTGSLVTGGRYNPSTDTWNATSTGANTPEARQNHTAIWTGSEMIVWGGHGSTYLSTGSMYNPTTNSWVPTSTGAGVPSARSSPSSVFTGSEMIIWGGLSSGINLNTGARYTAATDSWMTTSTGSSVPTPRNRHTAVWTGSEMIVWGGTTATGYVNDGGRYNPTTDSWTPTSTAAPVPSARAFHSAVWTGNQMIIWGGSSGSSINTGGRYNPVSNSWTPTSTGVGVPSARFSHSAVWTGSEMIVWGGGTGTNTGGRYNPSTDSWLATSTGVGTPTGRQNHTAIWTGDQMIVWGGTTGTAKLNTGGRYNPLANAWTGTSLSGGVPSPRSAHTAVWNGSQMIVWGGIGSNDVNTGGRYNPATDSWLPTSTQGKIPLARDSHQAVWANPGMIVWGGNGGGSTGGVYAACTNLYYRDSDNDGYGNPSLWIASCDSTAPAGYVADHTDCDDSSPGTHPQTPEVCNGVDDNCNGSVDEGFDTDSDGYSVCGGDCNDSNSWIYPGAPQLCTGYNTDCSDPAWPNESATCQSRACASPLVNIIAWWPFDDSLIDIRRNHLAASFGNPAFAVAEVAQGVRLDGLDDYLRVSAASDLDVGTAGAFTVAAWIRPDATTSESPVIEWNNGSQPGVQVSVNGGGRAGSLYANVVDTAGASHVVLTGQNTLNPGSLVHIALTYDQGSGSANLYVNGAIAAASQIGSITPRTSYDLFVGYRPAGAGSGNHFFGLMDELQVFGRALSTSELQRIFIAGAGGMCKFAICE